MILSFDNDVDLRKFEGTGGQKSPVSEEEQKNYDRYCDKIIKLGQKFLGVAQVYTTWDRKGLLGLKDSPLDKGKETFQKLLRSVEKIDISWNS